MFVDNGLLRSMLLIFQRFGDLIQGRRTNAKRIQEGFIRPTLKEAVPGDLSLCITEWEEWDMDLVLTLCIS